LRVHQAIRRQRVITSETSCAYSDDKTGRIIRPILSALRARRALLA